MCMQTSRENLNFHQTDVFRHPSFFDHSYETSWWDPSLSTFMNYYTVCQEQQSLLLERHHLYHYHHHHQQEESAGIFVSPEDIFTTLAEPATTYHRPAAHHYAERLSMSQSQTHSSSANPQENLEEKKQCINCGCSRPSTWRRINGDHICNACKIYDGIGVSFIFKKMTILSDMSSVEQHQSSVKDN
ncbi:hypothetical protein BDA99DRAFT_566166 [Phascolomyces articulosus]|uniref:GATA-type domain-containing protein n=1 Tax=Phascolomyces articulosus TaxID=60185 RepID=A0AAD5P8T6_9FUNG|nr:hypothetical protein BDA99DRAFT_566166 [Phascolomyces articulosus]